MHSVGCPVGLRWVSGSVERQIENRDQPVNVRFHLGKLSDGWRG